MAEAKARPSEAKLPALRVVIANRLRDGRVVYLAREGWSHRLEEAETAATEDTAAALLERANRSFAGNEVVEEGEGLRLRRLREHIRSLGPTVRQDLGYQAGEES
jgi:hypothetical protein